MTLLDRLNWPLLVTALVAGLLIGFAASTAAFRYRILHLRSETVMNRMDRELGLAPAQREQIAKVMEETRDKIADLRHQFRRERHETLREAYSQIRAALTPEQQKKFDRRFLPPGARGEPGRD